ncbi:MAG: heavy-metal-associated domain-containing protein [Candidatus Nanopelagicales bacterium]
MTTTTYRVQGMTCDHCVSAVTSELSALDGVTDVSINLNVGAVSDVIVTSSATLDGAAVRAAVDEAGYELVG